MDEIEEPRQAATNWFKKAGFYALLIVFGFVASTLWRGGSDAVSKTASLVGKTAGDVFAPEASTGNLEVVPLKSKKTQKTSAVASPKIAGSAPGVMGQPPVVVQPAAIAATGSQATQILPLQPPAGSSTQPVAATTSANQAVVMVTTTPAASTVAVADVPAVKSSLLFYEIQISGGTGMTDHDFLRIYNPNTAAVDVGGWRLKKKSKTGTESSIRVIPDGVSIGPGGTLIWANSKDNFAVTLNAGISSTATLSGDNSIALFDKDGGLVDAVAWGEGVNQYIEGVAYPVNPEGGQILRRKTAGQVLQDTNNNSADFST